MHQPGKIPDRIILYPRDVENFTGRRPRTCRQLVQKVRIALGKDKDEFITVQEFCEFYGIDEKIVTEFINK